MKRIYEILTIFTIIFCLSSCDNETDEISNQEIINGGFTFTPALKSDVKAISNWIKTPSNGSLFSRNLSSSLVDEGKLDYDNATSFIEGSSEIITISEEGAERKNSSFGISFRKDIDNSITPFLIVKTEKIDDTTSRLEYYSFNESPLFTIEVDSESETVKFTRSNRSSRNYDCDDDWADRTLACINDAYTEHGWTSVWLWVQSVVVPQTSIAVAGTCAVNAGVSLGGGDHECTSGYTSI